MEFRIQERDAEMSPTTAKTKTPETPTGVVEHFSPAWFASVMGTAVIPLAVSFISDDVARPISAVFMVLSVVMFLVLLVPWMLRLIRYREAALRDLSHPLAANFYPTMPIALVVIALDFLRYPDLFTTEATAHEIAWVLWLVGAIGIYLMGFVILPRVYHHSEITLQHANFGWYIPPVSKLVIPAAGFELAQLYPERLEVAFGLSIVSLGIGFFLFVWVGALVYQRYVLESLPVGRLAATSFIAIAPGAIIAVDLFKLAHLVETTPVLGLEAEHVVPMLKLGIFLTWGFAVWTFGMAFVIVASYLFQKNLPFALSWWAFTFPTGALVVSTGVVWRVTDYGSVRLLYWVFLMFLLVVWTIVAGRTVREAISGEVFKPSH